jgi:hypothetical protein
VRTRLSVLAIFAGMTLPAAAHSPMPPETPAHAIDLSAPNAFVYGVPPNADDDSLLLNHRRSRYESAPHAIPSLHIGSFHLELGGDSTKTHFAHYSLDGVKVLGGGISGSIDGRSARIAISWPSGS